VGTGWSWLRIGQEAGTCEYGDEPSGSKKCGNFLTSFRTSWLLKKDSAAWSKKISIINNVITKSGLLCIFPMK